MSKYRLGAGLLLTLVFAALALALAVRLDDRAFLVGLRWLRRKDL